MTHDPFLLCRLSRRYQFGGKVWTNWWNYPSSVLLDRYKVKTPYTILRFKYSAGWCSGHRLDFYTAIIRKPLVLYKAQSVSGKQELAEPSLVWFFQKSQRTSHL